MTYWGKSVYGESTLTCSCNSKKPHYSSLRAVLVAVEIFSFGSMEWIKSVTRFWCLHLTFKSSIFSYKSCQIHTII
jgi:hypothetical protein